MSVAEIPSGTVTFLFTDVEGSTRLWERHPEAMRRSLARHDALLREAVEAAHGHVVKTTGDGLMAVFTSASEGLRAGAAAQLALAGEAWGETGPLKVRMAVHTGEVTSSDGDYHGPAVNRTARLMAAGHGGQVLVSAAATALVRDDLPEGWSLLDLGEHRLKDLARPERVFQLVHPALAARFPPLATYEDPARGLPAEVSAFVGRELELGQVKEMLAREAVRLVTLVGPGGIGKTRLAVRAATELRSSFADGALFVDLAAARDTSAVLLAIGRGVGLADSSERGQSEELAARLRTQELLLVLDNFEQAIGAAPAIATLLVECPRLTVLVTSREPLRIRGEHLLPVPPLRLPEPGGSPPTARRLARYEAIALFVARAQAVRPDFELTDDNAAAVLGIVRRLDGLPLAIELATARVGLFTPEALLDRLGSRLALRSGARDLPERQQTLRATIEWSYQLLGPHERRLFALLAAFVGATLEDVESVTGRLDGHLELQDPMEGLASLADKSLLRQAQGPRGPRFTMLETIREYATERLDDDPVLAAHVRRAHALHFADFATRQTGWLSGPGRDDALNAMAAERDNLEACWRYWVAERVPERLDALVDALWPLYDARGWYRDTVRLAGDLLDVLSVAPRSPERARAEATLRTSQARALMAMHGYTAEVERAFTRAIESFGEGAEAPEVFPVLRSLANFHTYRAEFERASKLGRRMLRMARGQGDPGMEVDARLVLGGGLAFMGDLEGGLAQLDRGISTFEAHEYRAGRYRLGNDPRVACLTTSALILWLLGRPDTSLLRARRAVELAASVGHPSTLAFARFHAGFLHLWRGEPEPMRDRALGVLAVADEADLDIWRAVGTCLLGAAAAALGNGDEGLAQVREGIAQYRGLRTPPIFWPLLLFAEAWTCARAQREAEGLHRLEEALALAGLDDRLPILGELHVLRGDLLAGAPATAAEVRAAYERAFEVASASGARISQLRASLRRVRTSVGRQDTAEWVRALEGVHATFTEGHGTADVIEARALLEERGSLGVRAPSTGSSA